MNTQWQGVIFFSEDDSVWLIPSEYCQTKWWENEKWKNGHVSTVVLLTDVHDNCHLSIHRDPLTASWHLFALQTTKLNAHLYI